MLKVLVEETEKEKQDKTLINQLSKTIADNSKVLSEFGMALPVISKIKSLITIKFSNNYNGDENNKVEEELRALT